MPRGEYITDTYTGARLLDILPSFAEQLHAALVSASEPIVASQVERLFVPTQKLAGTPVQFSCLVYPIPRPTASERQRLPLTEPRAIALRFGDGHVNVLVDEFMLFNWIRFDALPGLYASLSAVLDSAVPAAQAAAH